MSEKKKINKEKPSSLLGVYSFKKITNNFTPPCSRATQ
jgi:hypothetical protein